MSFSELFSISSVELLIGLGKTLGDKFMGYILHFICLAFCQVNLLIRVLICSRILP